MSSSESLSWWPIRCDGSSPLSIQRRTVFVETANRAATAFTVSKLGGGYFGIVGPGSADLALLPTSGPTQTRVTTATAVSQTDLSR